MKPTLMMASLLLLAAVSANAQPPSQQKEVVQEIQRVDRERIQAQVNADSVALDRIYADDFIGIGPSGTLQDEKRCARRFRIGKLEVPVDHD